MLKTSPAFNKTFKLYLNLNEFSVSIFDKMTYLVVQPQRQSRINLYCNMGEHSKRTKKNYQFPLISSLRVHNWTINFTAVPSSSLTNITWFMIFAKKPNQFHQIKIFFPFLIYNEFLRAQKKPILPYQIYSLPK